MIQTFYSLLISLKATNFSKAGKREKTQTMNIHNEKGEFPIDLKSTTRIINLII